MIKLHLIRNVILLCIPLSLSACHLWQQPTELQSSIIASSKLNPNSEKRPSPLLLSFYELKTALPFKSLNFYQLSQGNHKHLGSSLLDINEIEIRPGETRSYKQKLNENTRYLGIVAAYQNLDSSLWKQIIPIPKAQRKFKIKLYVNAQSLGHPSAR